MAAHGESPHDSSSRPGRDGRLAAASRGARNRGERGSAGESVPGKPACFSMGDASLLPDCRRFAGAPAVVFFLELAAVCCLHILVAFHRDRPALRISGFSVPEAEAVAGVPMAAAPLCQSGIRFPVRAAFACRDSGTPCVAAGGAANLQCRSMPGCGAGAGKR